MISVHAEFFSGKSPEIQGNPYSFLNLRFGGVLKIMAPG
jgi:hypothetical protein